MTAAIPVCQDLRQADYTFHSSSSRVFNLPDTTCTRFRTKIAKMKIPADVVFRRCRMQAMRPRDHIRSLEADIPPPCKWNVNGSLTKRNQSGKSKKETLDSTRVRERAAATEMPRSGLERQCPIDSFLAERLLCSDPVVARYYSPRLFGRVYLEERFGVPWTFL